MCVVTNKFMNRKRNDMFRRYLPLYPITIGTLLETVLNISTASFAAGLVVVDKYVVVVIVGLTSSHS